VNEPAGVQMAGLDDDPTARGGSVYLKRLDPEVAGEAPLRVLADVLRTYL
jgi:hypothetical protein